PRPAIAHRVLVTPGPDRPDVQIIQGGSGFALVFNARRAGGNFHQVFPAQMTASLKALSNSTLGLLRNKITSTTADGCILLLVHPAAHAPGRSGRSSIFLVGVLADESLGGEEQGSNGGSVLERGAGDLSRVNYARLDQVTEAFGFRVEAVV